MYNNTLDTVIHILYIVHTLECGCSVTFGAITRVYMKIGWSKSCKKKKASASFLFIIAVEPDLQH